MYYTFSTLCKKSLKDILYSKDQISVLNEISISVTNLDKPPTFRYLIIVVTRRNI